MLVLDAAERRGYVDTSAGQVHFRELGQGPGIVLLHWAPGSSHQYAALLPEIAASGARAIAPDLPGFGFSCRRQGHWSIGDFADNLVECLDAWSLDHAVVWGGHLAAEIALETALRAPQRVALLVLDGTPTWDEPTRRAILDKAMSPAPAPTSDGQHLTDLWSHLLGEVAMWRPGVEFDAELGDFAMRLLAARMLADFDMRPARALLEYEALEALRRVAVPALALSADDDTLRHCHDTVVAAVPGAEDHIFKGGHPVHEAARAREYFAPVRARMAELGFLRAAALREDAS